MLTQERLRELMTYDPETGIFTCNIRRTKNGKWSRRGGKPAGTFDKSVGYVQISIDSEKFYAHRLAWFWMKGSWPERTVDHEDLDGENNRWSNLRRATQAQNGMNRGVSSNNKLGLKGVSLCKSTGRYRADIGIGGKSVNLGRFDCPAAAHFAYIVSADKNFGEYARSR